MRRGGDIRLTGEPKGVSVPTNRVSQLRLYAAPRRVSKPFLGAAEFSPSLPDRLARPPLARRGTTPILAGMERTKEIDDWCRLRVADWLRQCAASGQPLEQIATFLETSSACDDCGATFDTGNLDGMIPDDLWAKIAPRAGGRGNLCYSCMAYRLHKAGVTHCPLVAGLFTNPTADEAYQMGWDAGHDTAITQEKVAEYYKGCDIGRKHREALDEARALAWETAERMAKKEDYEYAAGYLHGLFSMMERRVQPKPNEGPWQLFERVVAERDEARQDAKANLAYRDRLIELENGQADLGRKLLALRATLGAKKCRIKKLRQRIGELGRESQRWQRFFAEVVISDRELTAAEKAHGLTIEAKA